MTEPKSKSRKTIKATAAADHAKPEKAEKRASSSKPSGAAPKGAGPTATSTSPTSRTAVLPERRDPSGVSSALVSTAWPGGFGATEDDELAFARGFPHLRSLSDEPLDLELARRVVGATDPEVDYVWPRSLAARYVRAFADADAKFGGLTTRDPAVAAALESEGPMGPPEDLVKRAMSRGTRIREWKVEDFVFLLEAEHGADRVADAILSTIEAGGKLLATSGDAVYAAFTLGFLVGRSAQPSALRERLASLKPRLQKAKAHAMWVNALDTVLDGDRAFEVFGAALQRYVYCTRTADLAARIEQAQGELLPDLRLAYLGGPRVLAAYERRLDDLAEGPLGRRFFSELSRVRRDVAEPLMRKLAARPDTGALAKVWLAG